MKSFDGVISDSSYGGVIKKSMAKKLGDFGIANHQLKQVFETKANKGSSPFCQILYQIAVVIAFVELQTL